MTRDEFMIEVVRIQMETWKDLLISQNSSKFDRLPGDGVLMIERAFENAEQAANNHWMGD